MNKIKFTYLIIITCISVVFETGCRHDKAAVPDDQSLEINQFIWNNMQYSYLWTDSVSNLTKYQQNSTALNTFLIGYTDHKKLFNDLLYPTRDKWSWIVDDYVALEKMFEGVTKTKGFEFGLVYTDASKTTVFGYVEYVVKGSPADIAGLARGDIFSKVDGQNLTATNLQTLLSQETYTISLALLNPNGTSGNYTIPLNRDLKMTDIELQENPILMDTVYNLNGTKTGYLMYNQFESNYDIALNNVFSYFKTEGVTQLVLDLRYNGGGSVQTAVNLSGMIYNTTPSTLILKTQYNNNVEKELLNEYGAEFFNIYFTDTIERTATTPTTTITSLGLSKLYVLTTGNTASASEIVINALRAFIPVITIGTTTVGKYVASITIKDTDSKGVVNPHHTWALQPIVLKIANAKGNTDFVNGFTPNISVDELNYVFTSKLKRLGDPTEPLLMAALNDIQGVSQMKSNNINYQLRFGDSKDLKPHAKEMIFNNKHFIKK